MCVGGLLLSGCASLKKDVSGISLVAGDGVLYLGDHTQGLWHDKCTVNPQAPEERNGWGFKVDLTFGHTIRPLGYWWKRDFWDRDPVKIRDIPESDWDEVFGIELAERIRKLDPTRRKFSVYNPWYGKHWATLRIPKLLPSLFFSISTPWKSVYLGNKTYKIDARTDALPYPGKDTTWSTAADERRCIKREPHHSYNALCPSMSIRRNRN